ncbi:MAG: TRAP transporter TatT component family protein [Myxococcota bacterium]
MGVRTRLGLIAMCSTLALGATGCIKSMLIDGQLNSTRKASPAINTLGDFEVARGSAFASLGTLEGLHRLAPENADGLFLLTKAWAGASFSFIEDEWEIAQDEEEDELADYHRTRARAAYTRAVHYGIELLQQKADGFERARRNHDTMTAWLASFDEEDVPSLFWTGYAWIARVNVSKDIPALVSELFVGVAMLERVVELDEMYNHGLAHVVLGAYHARTPMAELDQAQQHFERALQINQGKLLITKFQYARTYYCWKNDKDNYVKLLTEVVEAGDPLPEERLPNTIAKRRAKRYLGELRMENCGF